MSILVTAYHGFQKIVRSIENPAVPLTSENILSSIFGSSESSSGIIINRRRALTYAAVKTAVERISKDIAKLPLNVFRRVGEQGKELDRQHPAFRLLRWEPNPWMTSFSWHQVMMNHLLFLNEAFAFIMKEGARPIEIWPLDPEVTFPHIFEGQLFFTTRVNGEEKILMQDEVLHLLGLTQNGIDGIPLIEIARDSFGLGLAMQKYGSRFFANNAKPGVVLEHPKRLDDKAEQRLRMSFDTIHAGLDNAHRTAVLEEGMKLKQFSINPEDAQLIESREFEIRQVANWFNIPPHKLGDTTRTSLSSLEQEDLSYRGDTIDPWLVMFEHEFRRKLLTEREKREDTHVIEYNRNALVRTDIKTRFEAHRIALGGAPFEAIDEVRAIENLPELPDGQGKKIAMPLNMNDPGGQPDPLEQDSDRSDGFEDELHNQEFKTLIRIAADRCFSRLAVHVRRNSRAPSKFLSWLDKISQLNQESVRSCLACEISLVSSLKDVECDELVDRCIALVLDGLRLELLEVSGQCGPKELESKSMEVFERFRQECSDRIISEIFGEDTNETGTTDTQQTHRIACGSSS